MISVDTIEHRPHGIRIQGETVDLATSSYFAAIQKGPKLAESIGFQCPALGFVRGSRFLLCLALPLFSGHPLPKFG